jgi:hypothetical protein
MMTDKKTKADPLVAAETILIEGKAFERGDKITGVSKDELDRAAIQRRVIRKSVFDAQGVPAPEIGGTEPETDEGGDGAGDTTGTEPETDEGGDGAGDTTGTGDGKAGSGE